MEWWWWDNIGTPTSHKVCLVFTQLKLNICVICDMAFVELMQHNRPYVTWLLTSHKSVFGMLPLPSATGIPGLQHLGNTLNSSLLCCHLTVVIAEAVVTVEILWNTGTVAVSVIHCIGRHVEQNVCVPCMASLGLTSGIAGCLLMSKLWPPLEKKSFCP